MVRKIIPVVLAALLAAAPASAGQLFHISGPAGLGSIGGFGDTARNYSPVIKQASYCYRDCDICRDICYRTYRIECYGPGCRQSFVLCMRDCWYNICRQC